MFLQSKISTGIKTTYQLTLKRYPIYIIISVKTDFEFYGFWV